MCKISANKDQEKIADLAKMYNYIMSFKRSLFRSQMAILATLHVASWLNWIHFTETWYEQKL